MSTRSTDNLGYFGENLACYYLRKQGYKIIARNFRCRRYGEIDIIASKDEVLAFIEVKTRSSSLYGQPMEAVTTVKQNKIYRCAQYFMQLKGIIHCMPILSFDVIEVFTKGMMVKALKHYPHCF